MDDNYEEFYTALQNFNKEAHYNEAPHIIKNVSKLSKENTQKLAIDFS